MRQWLSLVTRRWSGSSLLYDPHISTSTKGSKSWLPRFESCIPNIQRRSAACARWRTNYFRGNKVEAEKKLGPYYNYTLKLLREFLQHEEFHKSDRTAGLFLLKALRSRKMDKLFEGTLSHYRSQAEQAVVRDKEFYQFAFELATEADLYYIQKAKRSKDHNILLKEANLDRYYFTQRLRDACEIFMRTKILDLEHSDPLLPYLLEALSEQFEHLVDEPIIQTYHKIYLMLTTERTTYYFDARRTLQEHSAVFPLTDLREIYRYLQNFCNYMINAGDQQFLEESFKLYKSQLGIDLLLENGHLNEWHYKNIVTTAIRLGETPWVIDFIEAYKSKLWPAKAENAYRFNLAHYYYATRQYGEVLNLLRHVDYSDLRYSLGSKALLLRTYYDLGEDEPLYALADSFRHYLLRNKLMANVRRQGYHNLFRFTRKAAQLRSTRSIWPEEKTARELEKLKKAVDKAGSIFNESWLREKIGELA